MELNISLSPEILFNVGPLPVTNSLLWSFFIGLVLIIVFVGVARNFKKGKPGYLQSIIEIIVEGGYKFVEDTIGNKEKARRVFPLVFTMFIFILAANLFPLIPGQAAVIYKTSIGDEVAFFRAVMSDYGMVLVLTLISVITTQVVAVFVHGPFGYLKKFINLSSPLNFVLGLMDLIGELSKILSLSFRLFGNIFAGEVLGTVMIFLILMITGSITSGLANLGALVALTPIILTPFTILGIIAAVIQAFVFPLLTLIFISMASTIEESEVMEEHSV